MQHSTVISSSIRPLHRRSRTLVALAAVLALGLAACGSDEVDTGGSTTAPSTTAPSTTVPTSGSAALRGRSFVGSAVTVDGEPKVLVDGSELRLTFDDDGNVGGSAGCNNLGGEPDVDALDDGKLIISGGVMMTEMACDPPALMDQDTWFANLLTEGLDWSIEGDELVLVADGTEIRLTDREVAEPDMDLEETVWTVDSIIDGETVASVPDDVAATLILKADGTAEVHTGCNSGGGTWSRDGDILTLEHVALTEMACPGVAGELEESVTPTFGAGTLTIEIEASHMTLMAEDGNGLGFVGGQIIPAPGEIDGASTTTTS